MEKLTKTLKEPSEILIASLSYGLIFIRLIISIGLGLFLMTHGVSNSIIILFTIVGLITLDHFDGELFRKTSLNFIPRWRISRRLLDSFTDRIVTQVCCISLLIVDNQFLIFYLLITIRELAVSGYCSLKIMNGFLLYPHTSAKWAGVFVAAVFLSYAMLPLYLTIIFVVMMFIFSYISLKDYKLRYDNCKEIKSDSSLVEIF